MWARVWIRTAQHSFVPRVARDAALLVRRKMDVSVGQYRRARDAAGREPRRMASELSALSHRNSAQRHSRHLRRDRGPARDLCDLSPGRDSILRRRLYLSDLSFQMYSWGAPVRL